MKLNEEYVTCPNCGARTRAIPVLPKNIIQTMATSVQDAIQKDQAMLDFYQQFSLDFPEEAAFQLVLDEEALSSPDFKGHITQRDGIMYYRAQTDLTSTRRVRSFACAKCHSTLPPVLFMRNNVKQKTTVLIGSTSAGKTTTTVSLSRSKLNACDRTSAEFEYYSDAAHQLADSGEVPEPTLMGLHERLINKQFNLYHYNPLNNTLYTISDTPGEVHEHMIGLAGITPQKQVTALCLIDCDEQSKEFDQNAERLLSYVERYRDTFTGGVILDYTKADMLDKTLLQTAMLADYRASNMLIQADLAVARRAAVQDALLNNATIRANHPKICRLFREFKSMFDDVPCTALFTAALGAPALGGYLLGPYKPLYMDALLSEMIWR